MTGDGEKLIERLVAIFAPVGAPAVAAELRRRLSDPATLDYMAFAPPLDAIQMRQVETEVAVAAERERCAVEAELVAANFRESKVLHGEQWPDACFAARAAGAQAAALRIREGFQ